MTTDPQHINQAETEDQKGGASAAPPETKPGEMKSASTHSVSKQKSSSTGTAQAALGEERRKAAEAQAELKDMQRRLAAVEAALAEERRKADEAQQALAQQRQADEAQQALAQQRQAAATRAETHEQTAEQMPGGEAAFGLMPLVGFRGTDLFDVSQKIAQQAIQQPPLLMKSYSNYMLEMGRVMTGQSTVEPDAKDKRFTDEAWKTNPFYHTYLQTDLTWEQSLNAFVNDANLDKKDADRARFVLSLFADTVAPTNTLLGNPAAMKNMYETGGASLVKGLTHMLEDLANNGGMPSQVDMKAFQVGKDLGISPGAVVFKNEVLELIQYQPTTPQVYQRPQLFVPPQVNKFYLMDLSPNKSLIRYLEAIDVVREITESPDINILGACLGGMTLATLLGYLAARGDQRIHAVTFTVTVLDTNVESTMGLFATKETIAAAKESSRSKGVLEGQELARAFAWLRPNDLVWNYWVNNYLIGKDPAAFDVLYWNNDTTRLPAKLHGEMLDLFETNGFTHPGTLEVLGTPIDLSKVTNDTYIIAGITDHITPWQGCYSTTQLLGGKITFILSNSGHIQAILNPPGNPKASYFMHERYPADAEQWLVQAQKVSGTWWDDWRDWLGKRGGEKKPAPRTLGNDRYQPGTPAPGSYVFEP